MFTVVEKLDRMTGGILHLSYVRNKFIKGMDEINPFIGKVMLDTYDIPTLNISFSQKTTNHLSLALEKSRNTIDNRGISYASSKDKKYSVCKIRFKDKYFNAKLRFHGTDSIHFRNTKKSLSIKLDKSNLLLNMRKFSLVILEEASVSTLFMYKLQQWFTKFEVNSFLVKVNVNELDQGIYLLEEKVGKSLLEKNNLSGIDVIKSFGEWDTQYSVHETPFDWNIANTKLTNISKKKIGQISKYEELYNCKNYDCVKLLIDVDKFAKVEAMRILLGFYNPISGNNQKLLYNTSSGRFIPYFRSENEISQINNQFDKSLYGANAKYKNNLIYNLGKSNEFRIKRNYYLWKLVSNKDFLIQMYDKLAIDNMPMILADSNHYTNGRFIQRTELKKRANLVSNFNVIKKYLSYSRVFTQLKYIDKNIVELVISPDSNSPIEIKDLNIKFTGHSSVTIKDMQSGEENKIGLNEIKSYFKSKKFILSLDNELDIIENKYKYKITLEHNSTINNFVIDFKNSITKQDIKKENNYIVFQPYTNMLKSNAKNFLIDYKYIIPKGEHNISDALVIPYGKSLTIEAGAHIRIDANKSIIVYGDLLINGTKEENVIITNMKEGKPFGVLGAVGTKSNKVEINYLNISGGKDYTINGSYFSGALSLYSYGNVSVEDSIIHHNSADDGLNIKNANIVLKNNIFNMNSADQVDLDFCNGYVINNQFIENKISNIKSNVIIPNDDNGDGLDFSGSKIIVQENYYNGFLDKGISVGENTTALIYNNIFKNNRSAITAKDQSDIYISSNKYKDNNINIEMYQKKKIFRHPSVYNINESHDKLKIKKTKKSHYYKSKSTIKLQDINVSTVFNNLKEKEWIEYE